METGEETLSHTANWEQQQQRLWRRRGKEKRIYPKRGGRRVLARRSVIGREGEDCRLTLLGYAVVLTRLEKKKWEKKNLISSLLIPS